MRLRRRIPVLVGLLVVLAAIAAVVLLRKHAPPEAARLLPGADGFLYVNLQWMRRTDVSGHAPIAPHDPEYDRFIQETGFDFERDLAQAAIAIHYASPATGGQTRFSEILVARVDGEKLRDYLKKLPLPSLGWAIFRVDPSASPVNPALSFSGPATIVASVQYLGDVHFRAEAFTKDDASAQQLSLQANTFLKIFESAEVSVSGQRPDPDFDKAMKSIKIDQDKERVVLTAKVPSDLIRKLVAEAPLGLSPGGTAK